MKILKSPRFFCGLQCPASARQGTVLLLDSSWANSSSFFFDKNNQTYFFNRPADLALPGQPSFLTVVTTSTYRLSLADPQGREKNKIYSCLDHLSQDSRAVGHFWRRPADALFFNFSHCLPITPGTMWPLKTMLVSTWRATLTILIHVWRLFIFSFFFSIFYSDQRMHCCFRPTTPQARIRRTGIVAMQGKTGHRDSSPTRTTSPSAIARV